MSEKINPSNDKWSDSPSKRGWKNDQIRDIATVSENGVAFRPDGKMMTMHEEEMTRSFQDQIREGVDTRSAYQPGDRVRSTKTDRSGYYSADTEYTVASVRRNKRTGKIEYLVTDIDSKDGGQTRSFLLTEDDLTPLRPDTDTGTETETDIADIYSRLADHIADNHAVELDGLNAARDAYLEKIAKSQKGHNLRRIRPDGRLANFLYAGAGKFGGSKLANWLTRPTKEEQGLSDAYETALGKFADIRSEFMRNEYDDGNITEDELKADQVSFIVAIHAGDTEKIAKLQKESTDKPMSKSARGFLKYIPGIGIIIRALANKKNANLKVEDLRSEKKKREYAGYDYVVDAVAATRRKAFDRSIELSPDKEPTAADVLKSHNYATSREIGKNKNRLIAPIAVTLGSLAAALAVKYGIDTLGADNSGTSGSQPGFGQPGFGEFQEMQRTAPRADPTLQAGELPLGELPVEAYVEPGSGEIRETKQILEQVLGHDVAIEDAEKVYNNVGEGIFEDTPTYRGPEGDLRIGRSDTFSFRDDVVQQMIEEYNNLNN